MDQLRPAVALCAVALVLGLIGLNPAVASSAGSDATPAATPSPVPSGEDTSASVDNSTAGAAAELGAAEASDSADDPATPSARSAQQPPSPTPTPTRTTPSPTPTATPTASPGDGDDGGSADLTVATRASRLLGQVGDTVDYTVSVSNEGDAPDDIAVVTEVPVELDIAVLPLDPRADAVQRGRHGDAEDIVWILKNVQPGEEIDLAWTGRVVTAGDLRATTSVEARGETDSARATADTFLATAPSVAAQGTTTEPPMVKRKVIRFVPIDDESGTVAGAVLPVTGWSPDPLVRAAGAAIAIGLFLLVIAGMRKPNAALVVVLALGVAACTQVQDDRAAPPAPDTTAEAEATPDDDDDDNEPRDRVKGTRITRGDEADETDPAADDGTDPVADAGLPDTGGTVRFERVVVTVTEPAEVAVQGSREGDNGMSFTWDEAARQIVTAASSVMFTDQPSRLTASLSSDGEGLISDVILENTSDQPLAVRGTLTLDVMQGGTLVAELRSDPIDVIVEPGGHALASFRYLLPSGDFSVMSGFEAAG